MASAQPTSSDLQSPCPVSHLALHIPEIVEQFLAYILHPVEELYLPSPMQNEDHHPTQQLRPVHHRRPQKLKQPDLFHEHRSPFWFSLLVCRQWFAIGMRLRSTHAVWCDAPHFHHPQTAPPAGPLGTLQLRLNFSPASSGYAGGTRLSNSISSMLVDVSTPCRAGGEESEERGGGGGYSRCHWLVRPTVMGSVPVRELVMCRIPSISHVTLALTTLASNLTMLELEFAKPTVLHCIHLFQPATNSTSTSSTPSSPPPFQRLRHLSLSKVILPCLPSDWGREGESRLRTLRLRDVVSDYPTLCRLLMALCGRQLEALHLGLLTLPARARGLNPMRPLATLGLDDIGKLSTHLTVFTMRWHDMPTMQDLERITTVFPRTRFVRLENPYLTMTAIREYRRSLSLAMPLPSLPSSAPLSPPSSPRPPPSPQTEGEKQQPLKLAIVRLAVESNTASQDNQLDWLETHVGLQGFLKSPAAEHLCDLVAPGHPSSSCNDGNTMNESASRWRNLEDRLKVRSAQCIGLTPPVTWWEDEIYSVAASTPTTTTSPRLKGFKYWLEMFARLFQTFEKSRPLHSKG